MSEPKPIVFVVDDDEGVRRSLANLISSTGLEVETFDSARQFLARLPLDAPGCLVLDVKMPELSGLELQKRLAEVNLGIPIIFISGHADVPMSVQAMKAGAFEFLTKPFRDDDLLEAAHQAIERSRTARVEQAEIEAIRRRFKTLKPREKEIMERVVAGALNKQIASALGISEIMVKVHRGKVMQKMGAQSLAELVKISEKLSK